MKVLGFLLAACITLAGLRLVVTGLVLGIILAVVIGVITRPKETIGFILFMAALGFLDQRPVAFLAVVFGIVTCSLLLRAIEQNKA
ncbi:hypothetical protein [Sphingomonas sp. G-3-2-10]|uniref:hypothetical protein n=1 Tax=Sphingomonas sp. G-3-2-10 TaxID=2728838 RepID=UPI00146B7658|nr:hypothetical protein [Sphingomonas sp. G-3-2-10]NML06530.1 hypothetical protein [Sphingomonas sp. G-3-2-10]